MKRHTIMLLTGMLLLAGCANAATEAAPPTPTASPKPPTNTPTQVPTSTPQLPTDTPEPTPTATKEITPTPSIHKESVEVAYEDKVLRGTLFGEGDIAVVLAPMFGEPRGSWAKFANHIAALGYTALAFDFPGPFGSSTGTFKFDGVQFDVLEVIKFLRERGYERIVCMGGSIGATACLEAALLDPTLAGLVVISAPEEVTPEEADNLLMPKLLMTGDEAEVKGVLRETYELLTPPKKFIIINNKAHGTDLLNTDAKDEFIETLVEFLESLG